MRKGIVGVSIIAIACLFGSGGVATARARIAQGAVFLPPSAPGGVSGRGVGMRRINGIRLNNGRARRGEFGRGFPVLGWPYYSTLDAVPLADGAGAPQPQVIVVSGGPGGAAAPGPSPQVDYSFVAGCRAIPNGYHCDPPQHGDAAH